MEIKKENPSKVIVIPRPPRSANPDLVPINNNPTAAAEPAAPRQPLEAVDPGCDPMNNQVTGPEEGLTGLPTAKPAEEE